MSIQSIQDYYATRQAKLIATTAGTKPVLMRSLTDAGIAEVTVTYDGEGDSGQITEITAIDSFGTEINITGSQRLDVRVNEKVVTHNSLAELVENYCWDLIGLHHDGFENNDGGFGIFTITVATGGVRLERSDRYVASNDFIMEV